MRPRDEVIRGLVARWMEKAEQDLAVARHLFSEDSPYLAAVGFHSQQAAEKFLKALLVRHQIEFPKTHDLDELLDLVARADVPLAEALREVVALTPYGVDTRYPGDSPEITAPDAKHAIDLAASTREAVRSSLRDYVADSHA